MVRRLLSVLLFGFFLVSPTFGQYSYDLDRKRFNSLIEILEERGVDNLDYLKDKVSSREVEFYPRIMENFRGSGSSNVYDKFLTEESVRSGRKFMKENLAILEEVEEEKDVPKEVIVSLMRVETYFGKNTGDYQIFGALASIVLYGDSARSHKFTNQLEALIKVERIQEDFDMLEINSSYAGAFGYPQFMPKSFLYWRASADGDRNVDLYTIEDSVWSIARFLVAHGWHFDQRSAVLSYNRSGPFVDCIFEYARLLGEE